MAGRPAIADSSAQQKAVLGALTKKDPNIVRVVDTAAHVALYEFDEVKQVWVRAPHSNRPLCHCGGPPGVTWGSRASFFYIQKPHFFSVPPRRADRDLTPPH